jgi:hypothetical protein
LGSVLPLDRDTRELGVFPISLFSTFPSDFPHPVSLDEPVESLLGIEAARIVIAHLPPRAGRCFRFHWPYGAPSETYRVCLQAGEGLPPDPIVGFELKGNIHLKESSPIAMTASIDVTDRAEPVLSFDLAGMPSVPRSTLLLGGGWSRQAVPTATEMFSSEGELRVDRIRGVLDGRPAEHVPDATGLPRDGALRGTLRFTPSRSVALATRRMDRYGASAGTVAVALTVSEVDGVWSDEEVRGKAGKE